ncbi:cardiolipin synthase [Kurthia sibirica]|uniref:Cardiolipin synthase n=1 Tax=Kurthia sibirica TaxID=202750 RepID=A0A2U3ANE2_9BACL|nr:cardiolipin synthase [Kurthia sibirica]PWI26063.1 cardiolipin synthase [Kurthia sibirica]GEK34786.1 cardiolipin synthase [Kurthia sibirica]
MVKFFQTFFIIVALLVVSFLLYKLDSTYTVIFGLIMQTIGVLICIRLLFIDNRETPNKIAWIVVVAVIPVIGTIMYLFFGRNPRSRIFSKHQIKEVEKILQATIAQQYIYEKSHRKEKPKVALRIEKLSKMLAFENNKINILTNGDATFKQIFEDVRAAQKHIHIQYYIYKSDELGSELLDLLVERAKAGVEVRFLYDGWGSSKLPTSFLQPLIDAGGEVRAFDPVLSPWIVRTANLRNHRKIVIIDGDIGFTGGLNVGNEYISKTADFKKWRDTHLRMTGPAVLELQTSFISDWVYVLDRENSSEPFISKAGRVKYFSPKAIEGDEIAQVIWGGPYDTEKIIRDGILDLIESSQEHVYISSPYFVPDEEALSVVRRAALSGIDVRILMPGKGDSPLSFHASNSYRKSLLKAGARVFNYDNESFIHNKIIMIDGERAAIGTANFDIRSFQLNHELMVFLYEGSPSVKHVEKDFHHDCLMAVEYTMEMEENKSIWQHVKESICRLFSPIL